MPFSFFLFSFFLFFFFLFLAFWSFCPFASTTHPHKILGERQA